MRSLPVFTFLLLISALHATGQSGSGGGGRRPVVTPRPRVSIPDSSTSTTIFLTGKVVISDGTPITESAAIQTICKGQKRTETHTDLHGGFSFQFGGRFGSTNEVQYDADTSSRTPAPGRGERRDTRDCELLASLDGFTSESILLDGRFTGEDTANIGRIVLHRIANVEGFTISATTAQAPDAARKAFEKGQDQQKKEKWDDAQQSFEKAVSVYPKYAAAWFELGSVQIHKNDAAGARHSFEQSLAADSKYIKPYHGLTQLALQAQNWRELADFSEKLLALNSVNFPQAWLSNSIGNYYLQNLAVAETSARRGLQIDTEHRYPKLEYLLGMILVRKPDYTEAAQHLKAFLSLSTRPADVAEAQKQLDELARLSAAASLKPDERK